MASIIAFVTAHWELILGLLIGELQLLVKVLPATGGISGILSGILSFLQTLVTPPAPAPAPAPVAPAVK